MTTSSGLDTLRGYFVTFNCGRAKIDIDYFAAHFFHGQPKQAPLPDLVVLSLQEVAPIAHSFIGNSFLLPYFSRFVQAVNKAAGNNNVYKHLTTRNVGMTSIMVLAKSSVAPFLRPIQFAGVGVGHLEMGNKGAVAVRLVIERETPLYLTLVAAHLAPMESAWQRRNQDWKNIVRGLVFTSPGKAPLSAAKLNGAAESEPLLAESSQTPTPPEEGGMFDSHSLVFFGGDLNYRTSDVSPSPTQHHEFPSPKEYIVDAQGLVKESGSFAQLKESDQLNRERLGGATLHRLEELPITFPPTYKYANGGLDWPSDGSEPDEWPWSKHRFPSWCDRILFSAGLVDAPFKGHSYKALPLQPTSDHRPVALAFSMDLLAFPTHAESLASVDSPFSLNSKWKEQRLTARRLEVLVGSVAYLIMTREGNAFLLASIMGAVGGWYLVHSMIAS